MSLLKAENIYKSYTDTQKRLDVLRGIDIELNLGEVIAIIGPSGAGKSTLLHVLGGLDKPDKGSVVIAGQDLYALSDAKRAVIRSEDIGFVFQFYHLLPELSALDNVILPARIRKNTGQRTTEIEESGRLALKKVGLENRASHKPNQLSGGEQQRVAIARALINQPKIVFCDEPTGNLDSKTGASVIELLLSLNGDRQQAMVIVTHDEHIAKQCGRVVEMEDGILRRN